MPQTVDYVRAHRAVARVRGKAADHDCVGCGAVAAHWTYDHTDPEPLWSFTSPYSHDVSKYAPRCVSCHMVYDRKMDPRIEGLVRNRAQRAGEGVKRRLAEPGGRDVFTEAGRKAAAQRRECECGKTCAPGPMALHQRSSGHKMKG